MHTPSFLADTTTFKQNRMSFDHLASATLHLEAGCAHMQDEAADTTWPIPNVTSAVLPFELYRSIVENVTDHATLLALCLASPVFKFEAQRVLYDSVKSLSMNSHLAFLRTMIRFDQLALLVHTYHIPCLYNDLIPSNHLLNDALRTMSNLRELFVTFPLQSFHSAEVSSPFIFSRCKFQLEALYLGQYVESGTFFSFLSTQKKLRKLAAYLNDQGKPPPSVVCPKLVSLQGNRALIETLLPNHQITRVIWDPDCYDARRSISHLSEPLRCLKTLSFEGFFLRPSLKAIVDHLQTLEFLELVTLHAGEIEDICKLSSLRALVLTDAFSFNTWERRVATVSPIFESCHQLEYIDMEQFHHSDSQPLYQRWACPHRSEAPVMLGVFQKDIVRQPFCII